MRYCTRRFDVIRRHMLINERMCLFAINIHVIAFPKPIKRYTPCTLHVDLMIRKRTVYNCSPRVVPKTWEHWKVKAKDYRYIMYKRSGKRLCNYVVVKNQRDDFFFLFSLIFFLIILGSNLKKNLRPNFKYCLIKLNLLCLIFSRAPSSRYISLFEKT